MAVHLWQTRLHMLYGAGAAQAMVFRYGLIPAELFHLTRGAPVSALPAPLTILTSMFLHGGWLHLGGNMLYLWIFGNNIEDRLGHLRFLGFYLIGGLVASLSHAILSPGSLLPMVGASGAIAAVLGAYLVLYPRARVDTVIILFVFIRVIPLPAVVVLGLWIVIQVVNGLPSLSMSGVGGVAWFAHIGGFLFGFLLIRRLLPKPRSRRRLRRPRTGGTWDDSWD